MKDKDIIRRALHDAMGWQLGLADAYAHIDGSEERKAALQMANAYRNLLRRKFDVQETAEERMGRTATSVGLDEVRAMK